MYVIRGSSRRDRGFATVIGTIIALGLMLTSLILIISLETSYQAAVTQRDQFEEDRQAENFVIDNSSITGASIHISNLGQVQIRIVSFYVNHVCRWSEMVVASCLKQSGLPIDPQSASWVSVGSIALKDNDLISVSSQRGNKIEGIFPIFGGITFQVGNNAYFGTGPLSIIFANWSFLFSWWNKNTLKNLTKIAWTGVPLDNSYINPLFKIGVINHATTSIKLLKYSVLFITPTTPSGNVRTFYMIVDNRSYVTGNPSTSGLVAYDQTNRPYIIPANASNPGVGGTPVTVSFAASQNATNLQQPPINLGAASLPAVVAVFLGLVFVWNGLQYSEDIPFATLQLCAISPATSCSQ